ncbi:MAG: FHA domain-containing protein [Pseudomonadota bacterium]|nr:FHA domain-containing protein [Pseudomonadota bacterium]
MRSRIKIGIGLAFLCAASTAQTPLGPGVRIGPLYEDAPGNVSVVVELPYGVTQPAAGNFHLLLDGKRDLAFEAGQVKSFLDSGQDLAVLVCIDVSGTMAGAPLNDIKQALLAFLHDRKILRVAVMVFASDIKSVVGFEDDRGHLTAALGGLKAGGRASKTRLYDALYQALDDYETAMTTAAIPKRMRIMVISDGKDEGSSASSDSVKMRSNALGIPIDAVGRGKIEDQYTESLRHLAEESGGRFAHAQPDLLSLKDALVRIYRELTETQTVVAYFKNLPATGERLTEKVDIDLGLPNGRSLSGSLKARIPLPPPAPKPDGYIAVWIAAGALMLLIVTGIFMYLRRSEEMEPDTPPRPQTDFALPKVPLVDPLPRTAPPAPQRRTQVGGYFPPPKPGRPAALLVGIGGTVNGKQFGMEKDLCRIGASPDNEVIIGDDDYVSSHHAQLRYEQGGLLIADQGSRNGTFLNDNRLGDLPLTVNAGDRVRIGDATFEIVPAPGR